MTVTQPYFCQKIELKWKKYHISVQKERDSTLLCETQAGEEKIIETVAFGSRRVVTPCKFQIPRINFEELMSQFSCRLF
jgi:hypothetical protein